MNKLVTRFAWATAIGMFLILIMGSLVTTTESGMGCGAEWPLCHGKFIPAYTISSFIEFSHRFVVGIVGLILLATTFLVFKDVKRKDTRWFVSLTLLFVIIQALMGAGAVIWSQSSAILALHFGLSLLAFAFSLLTLLSLGEMGKYLDHPGRMSPGYAALIWITTFFSYVVVYVGAFVRHTTSSGGCTGFPLCNGEVIPDLSGAAGIVFMHRVTVLILTIMVVILFVKGRTVYGDNPFIRRSSGLTFVHTLLQIAAGILVTYVVGTDNYVFGSLLHNAFIAFLFGYLSYLCVLTLHYRKQKM